MKESILDQISELNDDKKHRLYSLIESFLFDHEIDISKEQDKEKSSFAHQSPHCESVKTRKHGFPYGVQRFVCKIVRRIFV